MIEIEKKFLLTPAQQERLLSGAEELGSKRVEDSYFDTADYRLTLGDYWLRLRDGAYELKAPLKTGSGASTTNRYNEITDIDEITRELGLPEDIDFDLALAQAGITRFITCHTDRISYEKQGFHIDLDAVSYLDTDYKYAVAEIELLIDSESEADAADQKIIEFAQGFDLSVDKVVLGKVLAYLQVEKPAHYNALAAARVIT